MQPPLSSYRLLSLPPTSPWCLSHFCLFQFGIYFLHAKPHRSSRWYMEYSSSLFNLSPTPHFKIIALNSSDFLLSMTVVTDLIRNFTKHKCSLFLLDKPEELSPLSQKLLQPYCFGGIVLLISELLCH